MNQALFSVKDCKIQSRFGKRKTAPDSGKNGVKKAACALRNARIPSILNSAISFVPLPFFHLLEQGRMREVELQGGDGDVSLGQGGHIGIGYGHRIMEIGVAPEVDSATRVDPAIEALHERRDVLRHDLDAADRALFQAGNVDVEKRAGGDGML